MLSILLIVLLALGLLTGCELEEVVQESTSYEETAKANEEAVKNLIRNEDLPKMERSLERENIKRRLEFINQPDRIGYLYLLSDTGQLIREEQVLGKVSSLNSYLTPMEEIHEFSGYSEGSRSKEPVIISAPDLDGTYGENQDGIFWFTPDGVYREWVGLYLYSSERLTFTTQPILMEISN